MAKEQSSNYLSARGGKVYLRKFRRTLKLDGSIGNRFNWEVRVLTGERWREIACGTVWDKEVAQAQAQTAIVRHAEQAIV